MRLAGGGGDVWVTESDSESEYWTRDMVELEMGSGVVDDDGFSGITALR